MKTLILITSLVLVGCQEKAERVLVSTNSNFEVEKLFTVDGCSVYRFEDGGRSVYFTNCNGSAETSHIESCGKNCTRSVSDRVD